MVYYSVVYSHQYCITTWGLAAKNTLDPLEKCHKRIIRIITNSSYKTPTTLFSSLHLLKITDICDLEIAKRMYKITTLPNDNDKIKFQFTSHTHTYHTIGT